MIDQTSLFIGITLGQDKAKEEIEVEIIPINYEELTGSFNTLKLN